MFNKKIIVIFVAFFVLLALGISIYTYRLLSIGSKDIDPQLSKGIILPVGDKSFAYDSLQEEKNEGTISYTSVFPVFKGDMAATYLDISKSILLANAKAQGHNAAMGFDTKSFLDKSVDLKEYFADEATRFVSFCKEIQESIEKSDKDIVLPCERSIDMKVSHLNNSLSEVIIRIYNYMGGANSDTSINTYNFVISPKGGRLLKLENIVLEDKMSVFMKIAEKQFRVKFNITDKSFTKETGFEFSNEKFSLPSQPYSFSITSKGLKFTYALNEIAAYSDGFISFIIPYSLLHGIIYPEFVLANSSADSAESKI